MSVASVLVDSPLWKQSLVDLVDRTEGIEVVEIGQAPTIFVLLAEEHDDVRETIESLHRDHPGARVMVIGELVPSCRGEWFPEDASLPDFADALVAPAQNHRKAWIAPTIGPSALTRREQELLALIAEGKTGTQIAALMGISLRTVQNRKQGIFRRWNVRTQTQAVELALRHGLLDVRTP